MRLIAADTRPTDYEYALMSDHVYLGSAIHEEDILPKTVDWDVHKVSAEGMRYFGVMYINRFTRQLVVAHRGTDSLKAVLEDLWGILNNGFSPQKEHAFAFVAAAVKEAKRNKCHLSFTGHSLGAFLAELSVYYCQRSLDYEGANAVTFESPGSKESLELIQSQHEPIHLNDLDIISYVSYPNLINTCNHHVGTLYATQPNLGDWGWVVGNFLKKAHSMTGIVALMEAKSPFTYLSDWPVGNQSNIFFSQAKFSTVEKTEEKGGQVSVSRQNHYVLEKSDAVLIAEEGRNLKRSMHELYTRHFKAHYSEDKKMSSPQVLALRHFSKPMQIFLKSFYKSRFLISQNAESRALLETKWRELGISEKMITHLMSYQIEKNERGIEVLSVTKEGLSAYIFRRQLSQWLEEKGDKVAQLLKDVGNPDEKLTEITAALVAPGAKVTNADISAMVRGVYLDIPEGASREDVGHMKHLLDSILSRTSKVTAYGIAPGAVVEGGRVSGEAIGIDAGIRPRAVAANRAGGSGGAASSSSAAEQMVQQRLRDGMIAPAMHSRSPSPPRGGAGGDPAASYGADARSPHLKK